MPVSKQSIYTWVRSDNKVEAGLFEVAHGRGLINVSIARSTYSVQELEEIIAVLKRAIKAANKKEDEE